MSSLRAMTGTFLLYLCAKNEKVFIQLLLNFYGWRDKEGLSRLFFDRDRRDNLKICVGIEKSQ